MRTNNSISLYISTAPARVPHHSSPPCFLPCIAACRCRSASASPPAMLPLLSRGPASFALPEYPLSRESGAGFLPAGRLAGGAGGLALPFAGRAGGAGGGGGGAGLLTCSSRYALGAHPEEDLSRRDASHHPAFCQMIVLIWVVGLLGQVCAMGVYGPLFSFCVTRTISPFAKLSSPEDCPAKSYRARNVGSLGAGGAAGGGGGGGGGVRVADDDRECPVPFDRAATGWGTGLDWGVAAGGGVGIGRESAATGVGTGLGCAGRLASLEGPPPGPPGRKSLPFVIGFAATCLPFGVGLETELGGSPGAVWMVLLLYVSSLTTAGSLTTFTCASLPGFLLYSILCNVSIAEGN